MGWTFPYHTHTRKSLIDDILCDYNTEHFTCHAHACAGNVLWMVIENRTHHDKFIACYLLRRSGTWGYKDMTESMGPCYYTCPLKYLDMVPCPGGYATAWREKVRARHARVQQKLTVGQRLKLVGSTVKGFVTVEQLRPLLVRDEHGTRYRCSRRFLPEVTA